MDSKLIRNGAYVLFIRQMIIESKARNTFACSGSFKWFNTKMRPHPGGTLRDIK